MSVSNTQAINPIELIIKVRDTFLVSNNNQAKNPLNKEEKRYTMSVSNAQYHRGNFLQRMNDHNKYIL